MRKQFIYSLLILCFSISSIFSTSNAQDFTIGVISDTQKFIERDTGAYSMAREITDWYVSHIDSLNLKFVAALGDMTESGTTEEWRRVRHAYDAFKDIGFPYAPCQGNHDANLDTMANYFPIEEFQNNPNSLYGGSPNGLANAYYLFTEAETDYMILVIQSHDPFTKVYDTLSINWANKILEKHADRQTILVTHDFYEKRGLITDVITKHDNLFMAVCGHSCKREAYFIEKSPSGKDIHCIMSDYQCDPDMGATLRYYTFSPAEKKVCAYTYNMTSGTYERDEDSEFCFDL
jgi:hypothetical protein